MLRPPFPASALPPLPALPPPRKTFSKNTQKKAHWCSWPTTPHTVPFRKNKQMKISILYSSSGVLCSCFLFFFNFCFFRRRPFVTDTANTKSYEKGKQAAGRTSLLIRKFNYVQVLFLNASLTSVTRKSIRVHRVLLFCTVLTWSGWKAVITKNKGAERKKNKTGKDIRMKPLRSRIQAGFSVNKKTKTATSPIL